MSYGCVLRLTSCSFSPSNFIPFRFERAAFALRIGNQWNYFVFVVCCCLESAACCCVIIVVAVFVFSLLHFVVVVVVGMSSAVCLLACHRQSSFWLWLWFICFYSNFSRFTFVVAFAAIAAGAANFTQISNAFCGLHLLRADKYLLNSASQTPPSTHVKTHTCACMTVSVCVLNKNRTTFNCFAHFYVWFALPMSSWECHASAFKACGQCSTRTHTHTKRYLYTFFAVCGQADSHLSR